MSKKTKILKYTFSLIILLIYIFSQAVLGTYLYKYMPSMFYKIAVILILIWFISLITYSIISTMKKSNLLKYIISIIFTILFSAISLVGYYYLSNVYNKINSYSSEKNIYYSSLVSLNTIKNIKDLTGTIGIVNDTSDIEGYILPKEAIDKLKLTNEIKEYDSTLELLYALYNKEIDAAFFSSNYKEMFYSIEGYENIETETTELYKYEKEYEVKDETKSTTASLSEPFTMLFIGVDSSTDGVTSGYNADVLILVTFNPKTLRATMTSIPRDMYLKTACSNGKYRRINTTTWGSSSSCAVQTVENLFDVDIDYYAKVNFKGVVNLVDAVGGIDVNVDYPICEQNSSREWGDNTVFIDGGLQHLNGEQALALVRNRHKPNDGSSTGKAMAEYCPTYTEGTRNDYTRGKNQMKVMLGIVNAGTKITDPNKLLEVLDSVQNNLQTNINANDLLSLSDLASSIVVSDQSNLINVTRSQLNGYSVYKYVYEPSSKSYPAVTIPYTGSINDIKTSIHNNLNNTNASVKEISFDLNDPYKDEIIGNKTYSQSKIQVLKNLSSYSLNQIVNYASEINKSVTFIDKDTNQTVSTSDLSNYTFYSQQEHQDTILDQISSLTIYVTKIETKKEETKTEETTKTEESKTEETKTEETKTEETKTEETSTEENKTE